MKIFGYEIGPRQVTCPTCGGELKLTNVEVLTHVNQTLCVESDFTPLEAAKALHPSRR